jgi:hypothetical protein
MSGCLVEAFWVAFMSVVYIVNNEAAVSQAFCLFPDVQTWLWSFIVDLNGSSQLQVVHP